MQGGASAAPRAGRRVLVLGAASGIGAAVAERFARDGAVVWAADRNVDGCVRTVEWLATASGRRDHEALGLDVTDEGQWQQVAGRLRAAGGLDESTAASFCKRPRRPQSFTTMRTDSKAGAGASGLRNSHFSRSR